MAGKHLIYDACLDMIQCVLATQAAWNICVGAVYMFCVCTMQPHLERFSAAQLAMWVLVCESLAEALAGCNI